MSKKNNATFYTQSRDRKNKDNMKNKILCTCIALYFFVSQIQATVAKGDPNAAQGETFSFNIGHAKFVITQRHRLWLASGQDLSGEPDEVQKFGLSFVDEIPAEPRLNPNTMQVILPTAQPLANKEPATIITSTSTNEPTSSISDNPIYGANFLFFDAIIHPHLPQENHLPTFVVDGSLNKVYFVHDIKHNYQDPDSDKTISSTQLMQYEFASGEEIKYLLGARTNIFVAHAAGTFGTDSSKITLLTPAQFIHSTSTGTNGETIENKLSYLKDNGSKEISTSTEALKGGSGQPDLSLLGPTVTMHAIGTNVYVGLDVTADGSGQAASILISRGLTFDSIATSDVIQGAKDTVISAASSNRVRTTNIANMTTSTSLSYLIVARDVGPGSGLQNIYAVPLVSKRGESFGKVADISSIVNNFRKNSPNLYVERFFDTALTDPDQIDHLTGTSEVVERLTVGQGTPPLATDELIKDLYVVGDSVYIVIDQDYDTNQQPGTFHSQAIFAADGHIISWTPWKRVLGSDEPMLYSSLSNTTSSGFYVSSTGTDFKKVVQTQWLPNGNLSPFFHAAQGPLGGTQGLFNFPQSTPGFNNALSMLIATGFNAVTIGQTGFVDGGHFKVKPMDNDDVVSFAVSDNQALVAAEIAHDTGSDDHWLFAGGASGLAVLVDSTGVTWSGTLSSAGDLNTGQEWQQVGNFEFVKKLVWDDTYIYILTSKALYRIDLDKDKFSVTPINLDVVTVLESTRFSNNELLLDIIVDDGFCVLGTTKGLYSFNISTNGSASAPSKVTIADGNPAASQLFVISSDLEPQRSFKDKSNLYVLNNTFGTQQARLNRFVIQDSTIKPFNDALLNNSLYPEGEATSFVRFNNYVSNYFTNGSWNFASTYFQGINQPSTSKSPAIQQLYAGIKNGNSSSQLILNSSMLVPAQFLNTTNMLLGIQQETTSGAFIMSGNFEARATT